MRYRQRCRLLVATLAFGVALGGGPSLAFASEDYFGLGDGHQGSKSVTAPEVVNAYSRVVLDVTPGDLSIEVVDGAKFTAGDLVVVWQVNGYATPASGDQTEIDLSGQAVGRFEFARVDSVAGNALVLRDAMRDAFIAANTQVVFVPEYTDVTVDVAGEIQAADWDPAAGEGGLVAFFATGTVTVDGRITASGAGFLGGTDLGNSGSNGCTGLDEPSPTGAEKGESIVGLDFVSGDPPGGTGRGNRANGAGGGVCHNSGGGGGGHGGPGGLGGRTWRGDGDPIIPDTGRDIGGLGGAPLGYTALTHLTMGGGGGAGQQNNDVGGAGGDGGGVVFVRAAVVTGAGFFEANGEDGGDSTGGFNDAAGGAGAGGLIVVRTVGSLECGLAQAAGGEGGSAQFDDHGTGGGGAGGHTLLQGASVACMADVGGGLPGVQTDPTDPPGLHYGALPGELGDEESVVGSLLVDTDGDGLLDIHEGTGDTDNDGLADFVDVDDDGDGLPTASENADVDGDGDPGDANDQDSDLVADYLDLDSDGDGLTDTREAGGADDDGDGSPDGCIDAAPVDGQCDGVSLNAPGNTDAFLVGGDSVPDYLDTDSDADGINDTDEAFDADDDQVGDVVAASSDHDADGLDDAFDGDCADVGDPVGCAAAGSPMMGAGVPDDDGNGAPNWLQACGDGYVTAVPAVEACDDGDGDDANACNEACRFNGGFGPCAGVDDCASAVGMVCDPMSSLCQFEDGSGDACTDVNEGAVCQGGVCDADSGQCVQCVDDRDCAAEDRCETSRCVPRSCGDGVLDPSEVCDNGTANGDAPQACAVDCRWNVGSDCVEDDECTADANCGEARTCTVPDPRMIDSDGNGIPDVVEEDGFILQGGRGVGCHVAVTRQGMPIDVLLLVLASCLVIRRYRRN